MDLSKYAARIIQDVEGMRLNHSPKSDLANAELVLRVTTLNDEDPGVRYFLRNEKTQVPIAGLEGSLAVIGHNAIFFKRQVRKAEGVAHEVWAYYSSGKQLPCIVGHYSAQSLI